jgi:hypothetical protein
MASATAQRRLLQEYRALTNNPPDGITAGPVSEDDLLNWEALIQGPEGTPFEGGIFPAELKFPRDYPLAPPTMKFLGEIWHPNGMFSGFAVWRTRPARHTDSWQYTQMESCVYRFYTHPETTQTITSMRQNDGHRFRVWRRSSYLS